EQSDGIIRLMLGLMLLLIAALFVFKSGTSDYPVLKKSENFSHRLKLRKTYWESSLASYVSYRATNVKLSIFLFLLVGFTGGFFGLGGGWAAVPLLNLVMSIPIKVATGTSGVLLALGNAAAIWPYINVGALIGIIAAPWMLGQVIGGLIGASLLTALKASVVRALLITILFGSSLKLVARGIESLTGIEIPVL
ncbi:MAG: sulfite exporter TauE/SafE family protein, partial [Alphaproteobacteria bacterium]